MQLNIGQLPNGTGTGVEQLLWKVFLWHFCLNYAYWVFSRSAAGGDLMWSPQLCHWRVVTLTL